MVKNPPANAGDAGSIPGGEDPLEKEMRFLVWEISWTEEPARLYIVHGVARSWTGLND